MRIYTFASDAPSHLRAFSGEASGASLPPQHGPWKSVGIIDAGEKIPHGLDRRHIEKAIDDFGYQLWRMTEKQ